MAISNAKLKEVLDGIGQKNNGKLLPEAVVESARPKTSPIHNCFNWDDTDAAREYRLWQARQLIARVRVEFIASPQKDPVRVRAYASLPSDRQNGHGYREVAAVIRNPSQRQELLETALSELNVFEEKYRCLGELVEVFQAAKKARQKFELQAA